MKYGIIGAGNAGKAATAYLIAHGREALLYDRSEDRLRPIMGKGLTATGEIEGEFSVNATNDLERLAAESDCLLVFTVANGHRPIAEMLKGHLRRNQIIVITNSCWGAVVFNEVLKKEILEKQISVAETSGQLFLCHSPSPEAVYLKSIKKHILFACTDPSHTSGVLSSLQSDFPQFTAAANVLTTSLSATNPITHGPLVLFNLTRLENAEDYYLFTTGLSPLTAEYIQKIDHERIAIAAACGVSVQPLLHLLNSAWAQPQSSIYDAFHNNASYAVTKGPKTISHRYFTEDIPYGLAALVLLAKKNHVAIPFLDSLLQILSLCMQVDYIALAPPVDKMDLTKYL